MATRITTMTYMTIDNLADVRVTSGDDPEGSAVWFRPWPDDPYGGYIALRGTPVVLRDALSKALEMLDEEIGRQA